MMNNRLLNIFNKTMEIHNYVFYADYDDKSTPEYIYKIAKIMGLKCEKAVCTNDMVSRREFYGFCKQYGILVSGDSDQVFKFIAESDRIRGDK